MLATQFLSDTTLQFVLLGLGAGGLYAIVALGVVVTYRASGVLNFAVGSSGAFAAFIFYWLRDEKGFPWGLALVLTLALGAAIGALTQVFVMTLLRRISVLGKQIATLALMTLFQGLTLVVFGSEPKGLPTSILPTDAVVIGGLQLTQERYILIGVGVALAIVLRLVYSRTLFGLATSAVAENQRVAASAGWSPTVIELANFSLAGMLSATAAILLAPSLGLDASVLTLVVLPALAAALVGRFVSFAWTVAAALAIGVLSAELQLFQTDIAALLGTESSSLGNLPTVVPLLIIVVATAASGQARLRRGETLARLPLVGDGRIPPVLSAVGVVVALVLILQASPSWNDAFATTFAMAILVLSVVVVTGYAGQLSLCQFALAGFGAWVAARLVATQGWPFEVALIAGMVGTVLAGLVVALPALRTRGVDLAVATLALASMISAIIFSNGALTGGFVGTVVTPPHLFGLSIDPITQPERYAVFALGALVVASLVVSNVRRGRAGRRLLAIRANERAAASLGISVYSAKLYAFGLSSALAALSGILLGFRQPNVRFEMFDVFGSINAVLYAVVGGVGWVSGVLIGALQSPGSAGSLLANTIFGGISNLVPWLMIVAGVTVLMMLKQDPDGIAAFHSREWHRHTARFRRRQPAAPAPETSRRRAPTELQISGVTARFGGVVALDDVSFNVRPGEIVGLIGPNGAGKTTMIDIVTGFTKPAAGSVKLGEQIVDAWSPERRARSGIGRSWQAVELFEEMTVRENLLVAADRKDPLRYFTDIIHPGRPTPSEVMNEVIAEFELESHLGQRPSQLSQGTARLVGIGRAVITEPAVLLLDEPAAGLDQHERMELGRAIRALVERTGIGILIIEHDVNLLLSMCERIVVLDFGRKIAEGEPHEVANDPAVIRAYLGDVPAAATAGTIGGGEEPAPGMEAALSEAPPRG